MNSEAIPLGGNNVNTGQLCETHGIASHTRPRGGGGIFEFFCKNSNFVNES